MRYCFATSVVVLLLAMSPARAQNLAEDEYIRYDLQPPDTNSISVTHDVSAITPGAKTYSNPIPAGVQVSGVSVVDLMTGTPLTFKQMEGRIDVTLARPVPKGGQARIRILETFRDPARYHRDARAGNDVIFTWPLTVRRAAIVLPKGSELVGANVPVQLVQESDLRLAVNFMNLYPVDVPLVIKARALKGTTVVPRTPENNMVRGPEPTPTPPADPAPAPQRMDQIRVTERAVQDREIVYFLKQPETHAFSLYHDYTAAHEGEHQYVNVVRTGSTVSDPSAVILDTGEVLKTRTLTGADIAREKIDISERVEPDTQVVLIPFTPVKKGTSIRLRISETYTDPARYALIDGQLMWHRSFGRNRNDMVLPDGWYPTTCSIPAVVTEESDGRIRLSFWNPRPDNVDVFVKGSRR
jgi:hypothetical protein